MIVPYNSFNGSLYVDAFIQPLEQREYASQVYHNIIRRYTSKNKIHCVGTFHPVFIGKIEFERIVRIDPSSP